MEMAVCKCSFCPNSRMKDGKLICPYSSCILLPSQLKDMMSLLGGNEKHR